MTGSFVYDGEHFLPHLLANISEPHKKQGCKTLPWQGADGRRQTQHLYRCLASAASTYFFPPRPSPRLAQLKDSHPTEFTFLKI